MGRFESPLQVVGLFLAASVVSIGVIFFLNAEAHSRLSTSHQLQTSENPSHEPVFEYLTQQQSVGHQEQQLPMGNNNINRNNNNVRNTSSNNSGVNGVAIPRSAEINDASLPARLADFPTSSELSSPPPSITGGDAGNNSNVTLLNYLEDGLERLLSLIKQAKAKYKSYRAKLIVRGNETQGVADYTYHRRRKKRSTGRRRVRPGENEPYYWQMLEDNDHHHHSHQRNNYESHRNHHVSGPAPPPAVASAFTGGRLGDTQLVHQPSSDLHKIRHAMNKLGGGGLDISVVERMILDTKSSRMGVKGPPSWQAKEESSGTPNNVGLLTTATTKTTQAGRQDEGLFLNQLRHQQQELQQSLLPPTVTWLSSSDNGIGPKFLPIPESSLATGEEDDRGEEDDSGIKEEGDSQTQEEKDGDRSKSEEESEYPFPFKRNFSTEVEEDEEENNSEVDRGGDSQQTQSSGSHHVSTTASTSGSSSPGEQKQDCYHTDDVLIVVAITCCLNFAFVLVIWALVRWFSISSNPKEKDFQNLGDCDDTLDPTMVFHGVTEDPCWTAAIAKERAQRGGSEGGEIVVQRNCDEVVGRGTLRSNYSMGSNKLDVFPTVGTPRMEGTYHSGGGGGYYASNLERGSALGNGAAVMSMTVDRSRGAYGGYHGGEERGIVGGGLGGGFVLNGMYSFRPEHVPTHHTNSGGGGMVRSYSQSMEDLRYIQ